MSVDQPEAVVESLRQERLTVQKKTFTKWANIHLQKHSLYIDDLFQDLGDGLKLMKLLESLTGEKLGKPAKGSARINKIENVSRCLAFLHSKKMRLENISSEDIVDGKPHLILGLLWTIILRCEIWQHQQNVTSSEENSMFLPQPQDQKHYPVQKIAKESLLLWCQTKTNGYSGVRVRDFHRSWRNGLAFNALIHSHVPSLIDFNSLKPHEHIKNLDNAFSVAQKHIGVPRLLDPEDVDTDNPDEKSIIIYVSTFSKGLASVKKGMTGGKRITNILLKMMEIDQMKEAYGKEFQFLIDWIYRKIQEFEEKEFDTHPSSSVEEIQAEIHNFKEYRTNEKPIRNAQKNELEALLFAIQMKRFGQGGWIPPDDISPTEMEKAWRLLEKQEHIHEIMLRNELKDQEALENLAYKFESKKSVRENYLKEMQKILMDPNYGTNIKQADATFKKHEAIRTGILSREIMMKDLFKVADTLVESNYRKKDEIMKWRIEMEDTWNYVLRLLSAYDEKFAHLRQVMNVLEETDSVLGEMNQMQMELNAEIKPLDVEASLQNHAIKEVQIVSLGEAIRRLETKVESQDKVKDTAVLQNQLLKLRQMHQNLLEMSSARRKNLEDILKRRQQVENTEKTLAWIQEKELNCQSDLNCKDLSSALLFQKTHKSLGSDIQLHKQLSEDNDDHALVEAFQSLEEAWERKGNDLDFRIKAYQYLADAEHCSSWISNKLHLLASLDCGTDELTSEALLRRHVHVQNEIEADSMEVKRLRNEADRICAVAASSTRDFTVGKMQRNSPMKKSITDPEQQALTKAQIREQQISLEHSFSELQAKSEERRVRLYHNCMFYRLKDGCGQMEKWMREKERIASANDFGNEAEEVEKSFETFITDLAAHGLVIDQLKNLSDTLISEKSIHSQTARICFDDVYRRWQHIHELISFKEKNLKGSTSLLLAHRICDETTEWLKKSCQIDKTEVYENIVSIESLRRRQEAVEREIVPAEERVRQAHIFADNVSNSYPDQSDSIQTRIQTLDNQWYQYQDSIKARKRMLEESAGLQIFKTSVNSLMEWANIMNTKLRMREKIGDLQVAETVAKEHRDLGDEISVEDEKFQEIEELGDTLKEQHNDVIPLLQKLQESKESVYELWKQKQLWIQQRVDLQVFNRESDQLSSLCTSQDILLDSVELGDTLSDMEMLIRHHNAFQETLKAQEFRFEAYKQMSENLISAGHADNNYIHVRCGQVLQHRQSIKEKAADRKTSLLDAYEFQEFKADAQELLEWIAEKSKLASDLAKQDSTSNLSSKVKRQKNFEAEMAANQDRLNDIVSRGYEFNGKQSCVGDDSVQDILSDLRQSWDDLSSTLEVNKENLQQTGKLRDYHKTVESVLSKLDSVSHRVSSANVGTDLKSVNSLIKDLEIIDVEKQRLSEKVSELLNQRDELLKSEDSDNLDKSLVEDMKNRLQALENPMQQRRQQLETSLRFQQFKSDVDRELWWLSEQMTVLTSPINCRTLLDAQKFQKKIDNLEISIESHRSVIDGLLKTVLALVTTDDCPVDVTQPCHLMKEKWDQLLKEFSCQKENATSILKAQSFYSEANEIDSWIAEKLETLSYTDYGKDEDAVVKLLTKHKAMELEIDSYKGLVDELDNQAETLIESNNTDSKVIKNRMELIHQEMNNIQKLCTVKRQKLLESKSRHEFNNETEELKVWISEQMIEATSEDFGEDYEHILVLHQNFEFFRAKIEAGSTRIMQYEDFAKRLITSNCYFISDVEAGLEYLSARWSELVEAIEARAFKMEAAAEIHRYHRDVTDLLSRIHSYYRIIPQDLGNNLNHVRDLIKKHDTVENELLGMEAQVHLLMEDSQRLQEAFPGGNEEHIQMQLALVVENWNLLQQKVSSRKTQLLAAQNIHKFLYSVREMENWARETRLELESEATLRNVQQLEIDHKLLGADIETHITHCQDLTEEGNELLAFDILKPQIEEKIKVLGDIQMRVQNTWNRRLDYIQQKKSASLFFQEAKLIQAFFAKREVHLCGSENKETVEDLKKELQKHAEFQKSMTAQEEKFVNWKQQGETLLKQQVEESDKIEKKVEDLSERRTRLLDFSNERSQSLSEALKYAKFKRDTIEAESWILEKKNRLRVVLKGYNQLSDEEKIKCLQKQQGVQAELDAHEPFINNIIQQSQELNSGQEAHTRLQLILEDWKEVKENSSRIGNDLLQAREMLLIHDLFENAEEWIKEKELMIQVNDVGKDYEHCLTLQAKLDDVHSDRKFDENQLLQIKELAQKLSRNEDHNDVYSHYERIKDRWNILKETMEVYREQLKHAAEVHAFVKDADDTIERIREKTLILCVREETMELGTVQGMQRKLENIERDLVALDQKIKDQDEEAHTLSQRHHLAKGRILDKMNQIRNERSALETELKAKKQYISTAYTALKFAKDVNDFSTLVQELVAEFEFGGVPSNSTDAQSLLKSHHEVQSHVEVRQAEIRKLQDYGKQILHLTGAAAKGIDGSLKFLQQLNHDLEISWENRLQNLLKSRDLQLFMEKAKQVENWLSSKEAFLANQDLGDSISSVEALIRKHANFEEMCFANFEKIREIEMMSRDLKDHEDYQEIQRRCEEISRRRDALQEHCQKRKVVLLDAKALQQLLLELYEISNWMSEKIRIATDDSYKDLTNLLSKTQKHAAFEAEILANHSRVIDFTKQAEKLLNGNHYAALEIQQHVDNLMNLWEDLMNATNLKKERLHDAYDALQLKHKLEDINCWLEEANSQIEFDDYDSSSLPEEISKIEDLRKEAEEYSQNLRVMNDIAEEFQQRNHFSKEEISTQFKSTMQKFRFVEDSLETKTVWLQQSLLVSSVNNDINDELSWIEEKIQFCEADHQYSDVMSVQALQKKLQALESETNSREALVQSVVERGIRCNAGDTTSKAQHLELRFLYLKDAISLRRLRLADALEAQMYYFEANQTEMWIQEKLIQVVGFDIERNIYSVQAIQKKLKAVDGATEGFSQNVIALQEMSSKLVERNHFDKQIIQQKQVEVNELYEELRQNILKKTAVMREKEDFFRFERDLKLLMAQLKTLSNVTGSQDHGRDIEHVESLLQRFELFRNRLRAHKATVEALETRGQKFIEEGHTEFENIDKLLNDLHDTWLRCTESADTRCKVLAKEKLVHAFYKSVDETLSWIHEKDVALSSEDYGHDLESIKTLIKHHGTLEGDLKAIEEQVQALEEEVPSLSSQLYDSVEEIESKYFAVATAWKKCYEKALNKKDKLLQAEQLQSYFDEARDYHAWIYEMSAILTSTEIPEDVASCEALLAQHEGYKSEIDAKMRSFHVFESRGHEIIASGHFKSQDVKMKMEGLGLSLKDLLHTWEERLRLFERALNLQLYKNHLSKLEIWIRTHEHLLNEDTGGSIDEVERAIQRHAQFEKKLELYEAKFLELKEASKLDDIRKKEEAEARQNEENEKLLVQKKQEIRRREEERILEERSRTRTQSSVNVQDDVDEDYLPRESPSEFKRWGSKMSFKNKQLYIPEADAMRPTTPVIPSPKAVPTFSSKTKSPSTPPARAEGFLDRKQEKQSGGKRATTRQWKTLYTVLCGQLLCFFKDKRAFVDNNSAKPPVNILKARCFVPRDYRKKKYVFRLELLDGSSFLFEADNDIKRDEWMQKINFTASLPPSLQLMSPGEARRFSENSYKRESVIDEEEARRFSENSYKRESVIDEESYTSGEEKASSSQDVSVEDASDEFVVTSSFSAQENVSQVSPFADSMEGIYEDPVFNDPFEEPHRTSSETSYDASTLQSARSSLTSYDDTTLQSARSSLSTQSSYKTAAASTSSISTLQDERIGELDSDDEYTYADTDVTPRGSYSVPNPTPRSSYASFGESSVTPRGSVSESEGKEQVRKHQSLTLPPTLSPEEIFQKVKKPETKKIWKVFSLRKKP